MSARSQNQPSGAPPDPSIVVAPSSAPGTSPPSTGTITQPADNEWPFHTEVDVQAKPNGLWTVVREFITGPARIRFKATGSWRYVPDSECGPDGDMLSMISSDQSIFKGAPIGSVIAKIGGSSAGQTDGSVYLIGSFAVVEIGSSVKGPLYLTINDDPTGLANNSGKMKVEVGWKPISAPTPSPAPAQHAAGS